MKKELTIKQAAMATGYDESTLCKACRTGQIEARKVGGKWILDNQSAMSFGTVKPHMTHHYTHPEKIMDALDLETPEKEFSLDDLVTPAMVTDELEAPKEWMTNPVFTYEDLIEQYRRGFMHGFTARRSVNNEE